MARRRFFVSSIDGGEAELRGDDAHHLARVLRAEAGQRYEISDGREVYLAQVRQVEKSSVRFQVLELLEVAKPLPRLTLFLALIKFDRFEWAIEKATELGATAIVPVECARSEAGLKAAAEKRSERWRKIARESSQQARRAAEPEIGEVRRAASLRPDGCGCRLEERAGSRELCDVVRGVPEGSEISVLIGPEGGWTDGERAIFDAAGWERASLGSLILRAETAAIAALAVAGQCRGRGDSFAP